MFGFDNSDAFSILVATGLIAFFFFFIFISYILLALSLMFLFKKVGAPAYAAWIPFYNVWVLFEVAGLKGWYALVMLIGSSILQNIPFLGFLAVPLLLAGWAIVAYNLSLGFRKEPAAVWAIVGAIVPFVYYFILGLSKSDRWHGLQGTGAVLFEEKRYSPDAPAGGVR